MNEALFLRLLSYEDKSTALIDTIAKVQSDYICNSSAYAVDTASFNQVPGSPFTYWISEHIRKLFKALPAFASEGREVKQGLATADDFRFVRLWYEVKPTAIVSGNLETKPEQFRQQTILDKHWIPLAKGGAYSPYFSDLYLVVNWGWDGKEIRNFEKAFIRNEGFYFRSGLTWPARPHKRGAFSHVPRGAIFSHTGTMLFLPVKIHWATSALLNSDAYIGLLHLLMARGGAQSGQTLKYEIGYVASVPIPNFDEDTSQKLNQLATESYGLHRTLSIVNEVGHLFYLPALLQMSGNTLVARFLSWQDELDKVKQLAAKYQCEINEIAFGLYGIDGEDQRSLEESLKSEKQEAANSDEEVEKEEEDTPSEAIINAHHLVSDLFSYSIGCTFARWDIRFVTGDRSTPELSDPFTPLPVCSPGMLTGENGLPLYETPPDYPLTINWNGILVDDPEHPEDIIGRIRDVLRVIWQDCANVIEQEACQILGVKELREYFRKPGNGGFWTDHIQRYSKSRRKAPIYWLLQSSKKNYAIWLYYHRLNKDTLFKILNTVVEPKLRLEETQLEQLRTQLTNFGTAGREAKQLERQLDRQENFISELEDFRDKLRRAADLNLEPDLNDGVVLNIAPLWELVPWNEAKRYWQELRAGKYEWSTIGKQLRERGLA